MRDYEAERLPHEVLAERVRNQGRAWHAWTAKVDALERRLALEGWPESAMGNALLFADGQRQYWCGELLTVFGVDVATTPATVREPESDDVDRYTVTAMCAIFWQQTSRALWKQHARAVQAGLPPARHVCEAYITALRCKAVVAHILLEQSPDLEWREEGALMLGGAVGAELNLAVNNRLAAALSQGDSGPKGELWEQVTGAALVAWGDSDIQDRAPDKLRNRTASILSSDEFPRKKLLQQVEDPQEVEGRPAAKKKYMAVPVQRLPLVESRASRTDVEAEALSREELRDLLDRAKNAPRGRALSKQQQDLVELKLQGLRAVDIANHWSVSVGAVKKQWDRVQTKLRKLQRAG